MPSRFLSADEQHAVVAMLEKGASPAIAVREAGRSIHDFYRTHQHDAAFRHRCRIARAGLAGNAAAALYRQGLEGNIAALTYFLRHNRPPEWNDEDTQAARDEFEEYSDEDLIRSCESKGVDLPAEVEPRDQSAAGEDAPQRLPPKPAIDE